jgi:ATP/maltotriose-dependent transcriptional regulator MalT
VLKPPFEKLHRAGERNFVPTAAALLAEAAYARGNYDDAESLSRVSEETASASDLESQYRWRCVRGKIFARRGQTDAARELLSTALELVRTTDGPVLQADVHLDLAVVHAFSGDLRSSVREREQAEQLYASKGDVVSSRSRIIDGRLDGVSS